MVIINKHMHGQCVNQMLMLTTLTKKEHKIILINQRKKGEPNFKKWAL